ncbi:MAG: hypothetical protein ACREOE_02440 [Gemmatimonadales bacterium]
MKPHTPPEQDAVACATLVEHAVGEPNVPLAVQLSVLDPEHVVWPGAHWPVQTPLTHVWLLHAVPFCHVPVLSQVCGWVPEVHWSPPGVQEPVQLPPTQAWLVQAVAFCHAPVLLQVCGCWPLHCFCPGAHTPVQRPVLATHV